MSTKCCVGLAPMTLRTLEEWDFDQLREVHRAVIASLPDRTLFRDVDDGYLQSFLAPDADCFGVFDGERIVAYAAVRYPAFLPDTARLAGLSEEDAGRVAEFDGSAVLPGYRGRGLQRVFNEVRARAGLSRGCDWSIATVSPANPYSLRNFLDYGMTGRALTRLYGGVSRLVVGRDHAAAPEAATGPSVVCPCSDLDAVAGLFARGGRLVAIVAEDVPSFRFETPVADGLDGLGHVPNRLRTGRRPSPI